VSLLSERALKTMERMAERSFVDTLELHRGSSTERDPSTGVESYVPGDTLWSGLARVRPTRGPREQGVGEGVVSMRDADFLFPLSAPLPWRDDAIKVVGSRDAKLVGLWFRITDVRMFSQQSARSCSGIQIQPSRLWPGEQR